MRLACNVKQVHEFLPIPAFTPVPGTKPWILGLANVRGDLLTIVDLAWFLNGKRSTVSMRTRLLAASSARPTVGLLVDEVFGQRHFVSDEGKKHPVTKELPAEEICTYAVSVRQRRLAGTGSGKPVFHLEFLNGAAA